LIAQPRTIFHAKDDRLIEPERVEELAELLDVEVQWFETGGHNPQKTQAMEIAAQVPSPRPT
jgi:predicted alpha/beta-fold hydrolase